MIRIPVIRWMTALAAAAPLLGGCVVYSSEAGEQVSVHVTDAVSAAEPLETVRAVSFENGRLNVRVDSNGCTEAAGFEVRVRGENPAELTLVRREPDLCKALVPEGVVVSWTYEELGLAAGVAARVLNPVRL